MRYTWSAVGRWLAMRRRQVWMMAATSRGASLGSGSRFLPLARDGSSCTSNEGDEDVRRASLYMFHLACLLTHTGFAFIFDQLITCPNVLVAQQEVLYEAFLNPN
jgi:hypothetical protein